MDKKNLLQSASQINQPSEKAAAEYEEKGESIAKELTERLKQRPDIENLVGTGNIEMMGDNHLNHYRFISSLIANYTPATLLDTILWVFRAYRSHGFELAYWPAQLNTWITLLRDKLTPQSFKEIYPIYNWMLVNQAGFVAESDKIILSKNPPLHGGDKANTK